MLRTKINVNLGVSRDFKDYDIEMQKQFETTGLPSMMTPVQCAENSVRYAV